MLQFEWDEDKNRKNRVKHGIWFEEAQSVFDDFGARVFMDADNSKDEDRFIIIGFNASAKVLVVVHCYREADTVVRIISARKATRREIKFYAQGV
jgi:uncharacterized protein